MRSQMRASPKLVTPPPPNIQIKQAMRFTASVALFTVRAAQRNFRHWCKHRQTNIYLIHAHANREKSLI